MSAHSEPLSWVYGGANEITSCPTPTVRRPPLFPSLQSRFSEPASFASEAPAPFEAPPPPELPLLPQAPKAMTDATAAARTRSNRQTDLRVEACIKTSVRDPGKRQHEIF